MVLKPLKFFSICVPHLCWGSTLRWWKERFWNMDPERWRVTIGTDTGKIPAHLYPWPAFVGFLQQWRAPSTDRACIVNLQSSLLNFRPFSAENTDNVHICKQQKHWTCTCIKPVQWAQPVYLFRCVTVITTHFNTMSIWGCEINLADTVDWWIWSCSAVLTLKNRYNNKSVSTYIWLRKATTCTLMSSWCSLRIPSTTCTSVHVPVLDRYWPNATHFTFGISWQSVLCVLAAWQIETIQRCCQRHNRYQTYELHTIGVILTQLLQSERGIFSHACCYLPLS